MDTIDNYMMQRHWQLLRDSRKPGDRVYVPRLQNHGTVVESTGFAATVRLDSNEFTTVFNYEELTCPK